MKQDAPSMLDLVRLSPRLLFPPGGEELYRQIAILTGMAEGMEVLEVGCGKAVPLEYFVTEYGVHGSGVEGDARLVQQAVERARTRSLGDRMQVQQAPADALPYRDGIFDVAVGEVGMTAMVDPARAVSELVRVTRPGGSVVLVQLVWRAPVEEERRALVEEHLGVRPLMLVEWKRLLRGNGVEGVHSEDWTDRQTAFRPGPVKPFPDFAELFSLPEKLGILRRAWSRYGWRGVRAVLAREREVHRLLSRDRIIGLDLLKGVRGPPEATDDEAGGGGGGDAEGFEGVSSERDVDDRTDVDDPTDVDPHTDDDEQTEGLPLFSPDGST
jgi:SAM-dependent methyltransferase